MDVLDRLLDYDTWITGRVLHLCNGLSDEQLGHRFDIGWETIRATLVHIVRNMELWCDLLHERTPSRDREEAPGIGVLIDHHRAVATELRRFARNHALAGTLDAVMLDTLCEPPVPIRRATVLCDIIHENMVHRSETAHGEAAGCAVSRRLRSNLMGNRRSYLRCEFWLSGEPALSVRPSSVAWSREDMR